MNDPMTDADYEYLKQSARTLSIYRSQRAESRLRARALLDAMAAEARRSLGEAFTVNDPVTGFPVALVVRSDERLPDDYEVQTPRPPIDTVSRLIVDVLGRSVTIEMNDAGAVTASGDAQGVALDGITGVRVDDDGSTPARTFLVTGGDDADKRPEIPFARVLAGLIDTAVQVEARFLPADAPSDNAT